MERETAREKRTRNGKPQAEGVKWWIIVPWFFYVHNNSTENVFPYPLF